MFTLENITIIDHLLTAVFTIALPLLTFFSYPKLVEIIKSGVPNARTSAYIQSIITLWLLAAVTVGVWIYQGRNLAIIGFVIIWDLQFYVCLGIVILIIAFLAQQIFEVSRKQEARDKIRKELEKTSLDALIPHTEKELKVFMLVSVTAGICEEIMFRGFLIAYLSHYMDTGLALILSSALFGMGHLYQGFTGVLRTMFVGAGFAILYALSGSLLAPVILHAAIDVHAGITGKLSLEFKQNGISD